MRKINEFKQELKGDYRQNKELHDKGKWSTCLPTRMVSGTKSYKLLRPETATNMGIASRKYRKVQSLQDSLAIRNANSTNTEITIPIARWQILAKTWDGNSDVTLVLLQTITNTLIFIYYDLKSHSRICKGFVAKNFHCKCVWGSGSYNEPRYSYPRK